MQGMSETTEQTYSAHSEAMNVIDSQLNVITNAIEWPDDIYDNMQTDKIKVISAALNIIHKAQWVIIKEMSVNYRPGTAREP